MFLFGSLSSLRVEKTTWVTRERHACTVKQQRRHRGWMPLFESRMAMSASGRNCYWQASPIAGESAGFPWLIDCYFYESPTSISLLDSGSQMHNPCLSHMGQAGLFTICYGFSPRINMLQKSIVVALVISLLTLGGCGAPRGPKYQNVRSFSEGLAPVQASNGKWGYINESQQFVISPRFEDAKEFQSGKAAVKANSKWGFINRRGEWL